MGGTQRSCDRGGDDLFTGCRDDDHVAATQSVVCDQFCSFRKDQRIDDVVQSLGDDGTNLFDVPAGAHRGDVGAHPVHLVVIGAGHQEKGTAHSWISAPLAG